MKDNNIKITTDNSERVLSKVTDAVTIHLDQPGQTVTIVTAQGTATFSGAGRLDVEPAK